MTDTERRLIGAASSVADNMRSTADRLQRAIDAEDFDALAEIQLSQSTWTLDAVRGAAWATTRGRL